MTISPIQMDILQELLNIGVGKAAGMMNEMLQEPLTLSVPSVTILEPEQFMKCGNESSATVCQRFYGKFAGSAALVFPSESAAALVTALTGEEGLDLDLDEIRIATLTEVGNIVLNGVMGTITNTLQQHIEYSVPSFQECTPSELLKAEVDNGQGVCLLAETKFKAVNLRIEGQIHILFKVGSFDLLLEAIDALVPAG